MAVPRHVVEEILGRTDIVELVGRTVTLRRAGRSYTGLCPFHTEKTPSFHVLPHKGIYHCFGCGEGGDAVSWLRKTRGMSFMEAVKELAQPLGITIEERELAPEERQRLQRKTDLYGLCDAAAGVFHTTLLTSAEGETGRAYLARRGISLDTATRFRLGFAPDGWTRLADQLHRMGFPLERAIESGLVKRADSGRVFDTFRNRLVFPILDDRDRPIAFGGRLLDGEGPKYLNTSESSIYSKSKVLYGLSWARGPAQRRDRIILVEGYFDAVSLWQAGFGEAVATCGTALTAEHMKVVQRITRKVVALFDTDEAGVRAAAKSMELFLEAEVSATRLDLSPAKDPDEFVQTYGADAFEERLARGEPLVDLVIRRTIAKEGRDATGQARALTALLDVVRRLPATVRAPLVLKLAGELNVRESDLLARLGTPEEARPAPASAPAPTRWVPSKELSHLLWLVIHFPAEVAPVLADADPEAISDRQDVLRAMVQLASGEPLAVVADGCTDAELGRVLRAVAARTAEYTEEVAAAAAVGHLARLELPRVQAKLRTKNAEIVSAYGRADFASAGALKAELSALNARIQELNAQIARGARRT